MNDGNEDIEFQQTPGWGLMVMNGWGVCILLIMLCGAAGMYSVGVGILVGIVSIFLFFMAAFVKVFWSARENERIICRNVYFFGFLVSSKFQRIEQNYWLQCRRASSGLVLEMCKGNAWESIVLQEVCFGKMGPSKLDRQILDRLRASLAKIAKIEDRGWDRYAPPGC